MVEPWQPERVVDPELARQLIESQFPELAGKSLVPLRAGWDNTVYRMDHDFVFRFPRRELAVRLLAQELALLPALSPELPIAIPVPVFAGRPTAAFAWPFAGYRFIPGETACSLRLGARVREDLAEPLADFLSTLHAFPAARARELGAGEDELDRLYVARRAPRVRSDLRELLDEELLPPEIGTELEALLERALTLEPPARGRCLVHGDLYVRHLVLDETPALAGVIDWGDVHVGLPEVDLALAYAFLPPAARQRFFARYGAISDESRLLVRFRAAYHGLSTLKYAARTGDADLLYESELSLSQLLAP